MTQAQMTVAVIAPRWATGGDVSPLTAPYPEESVVLTTRRLQPSSRRLG